MQQAEIIAHLVDGAYVDSGLSVSLIRNRDGREIKGSTLSYRQIESLRNTGLVAEVRMLSPNRMRYDVRYYHKANPEAERLRQIERAREKKDKADKKRAREREAKLRKDTEGTMGLAVAKYVKRNPAVGDLSLGELATRVNRLLARAVRKSSNERMHGMSDRCAKTRRRKPDVRMVADDVRF